MISSSFKFKNPGRPSCYCHVCPRSIFLQSQSELSVPSASVRHCAAAMLSEESGDESSGFPQVGQGVDETHYSHDQLAKDLETEFDALVELANRTSVDDGGLDDFDGTDHCVPLPLAEPTAGSSSEPTSPSPSPGIISDQSGSSTTVTPISHDMKRRRISIKRGTWEAMSVGKSEKLNPGVFVNNPCLTHFQQLPQEQKTKVLVRMRVRKHRQIEAMKKGLNVIYRGNTHVWPENPDQEAVFMQTFLVEHWYDIASCPTADIEERGFAMDRLVTMHLASALTFEGKELEKQVLKQKSIMMTYQGEWGVLPEFCVCSHLSVMDVAHLVKQSVPVKEMFQQFLHLFERLRSRRKIKNFVVSQEICCDTWISKSILRVHFHAWIMKSATSTLQLQDLHWKESSPYVNSQAAEFFGGRGSRSASASYSGAFYLQIEKIGGVRQQGTLDPFTGYTVKDFWITNLLAGKKITFDTARTLYAKAVIRAEHNTRQLDFVERTLLDMQSEVDKAACEAEILKMEVEFRSIPEVELWKRQFSSVKSRYLFLVLDGPSQTGKTRFAYSLSPPPTTKVGSPAMLSSPPTSEDKRKMVYYADCSGGLPDLRNFRRKQHKILVLDELHPENAVVLKKIMQSSNDEAVMGSSPTMQHAYRVNSYQTMIVVTTNTWSSGLCTMPAGDVDWLKANSVYVHVTGPLWKQRS